jgi:hypothetical protein
MFLISQMSRQTRAVLRLPPSLGPEPSSRDHPVTVPNLAVPILCQPPVRVRFQEMLGGSASRHP